MRRPFHVGAVLRLVAILLVLGGAAPVHAGRVLFADDFHSPDTDPASGGVNAGIREPGRQSGALAPLPYKQKTEPSHQMALRDGRAAEARGVNGRCSLDHDFLTDLAGAPPGSALTVQCAFATPKEGNSRNGAFVFFSLENTPGVYPDNAGGLGVVLAENGTGRVYFAGGSSEDLTYTAAGEGAMNQIALRIEPAPDGSADTIAVMINGRKFQTYVLGKGGFGSALKGLYLTFGAEFNAAGAFDDLSIAVSD